MLCAFVTENAGAEIIFRDKCFFFTGAIGKNKEVKFCPALETEFFKPKAPIEANGKAWDWVVRTPSYGARLIPDSRSAFVYIQNYYDSPAADVPGKKLERVFASGVISRGYQLRYFGGDGLVLWEKVVAGEGHVIDQKISYDGSLIVLLIAPDLPVKYPPEKPNGPPAHWLTIYDNKGVRLMDFPKRYGICEFYSIYNFWISKTGKYMMAECRREFKGQTGSYFLQPKKQLFWQAAYPYQIDRTDWKKRLTGESEPWTDEDEEFGRLDLRESRDGKVWEQTDLTLAGVDWKPIESLR